MKTKEVCGESFHLRIPPMLKKALSERAEATGESPSAVIRAAIKNFLAA